MRAIFLVYPLALVPTRRVGMQWQRAALRNTKAYTTLFSRSHAPRGNAVKTALRSATQARGYELFT